MFFSPLVFVLIEVLFVSSLFFLFWQNYHLILLLTFFLDKKSKQKSQGRRNRSACPSWPAHNSHSAIASIIHCVLNHSFIAVTSLLLVRCFYCQCFKSKSLYCALLRLAVLKEYRFTKLTRNKALLVSLRSKISRRITS